MVSAGDRPDMVKMKNAAVMKIVHRCYTEYSFFA